MENSRHKASAEDGHNRIATELDNYGAGGAYSAIMKLSLAPVVLGLVILGACGPTIHPPTGPNTEYPCGLQGKSCDPIAPGRCCALDEDCGYTGPWSTCPAGFCCYNGGTDTRYPGSSGRARTKQTLMPK